MQDIKHTPPCFLGWINIRGENMFFVARRHFSIVFHLQNIAEVFCANVWWKPGKRAEDTDVGPLTTFEETGLTDEEQVCVGGVWVIESQRREETNKQQKKRKWDSREIRRRWAIPQKKNQKRWLQLLPLSCSVSLLRPSLPLPALPSVRSCVSGLFGARRSDDEMLPRRCRHEDAGRRSSWPDGKTSLLS